MPVKKVSHLIKTISTLLGIENDRTKNITKHISLSFIYKALGLLSNFMIVPLTINLLNTERYGIWITLTSFVSWFQFFDVGLGNSLRNKIAEAHSKNNFLEAKGYVSTAYISISLISILVFIVFLIFNKFINWTTVFNTDSSYLGELNLLLPTIFSFFCIQLVLKLVINIYQGLQDHSIQEKATCITQVTSLVIIYVMTKTNTDSLLLFGAVFSFLPVLILLIFNLFAFKNQFAKFKPNFKYWNKKYFKDISSLGISFFFTKIGALVLLSSDSFIVAQLFSPEDVVPYNLAYKYFSILIIFYSIIVTPYWSSFTMAYSTNDFKWIKHSVKTIQKIWLSVPLILILMISLSDTFYMLWVGDKVNISSRLSYSMAFYVLLYTFNLIYNNFINGVGKIKLHLLISLFIIVFNIPLSIFMAKNLNLGLSGVILATCVCLTLKIIFLPAQYFKIINNNAKGIWGK